LCSVIFFDRTVVPFSCFLSSDGKTVDQFSDVLWSKLSSKGLTVPDRDRFLDIAVKFLERWNFPNVTGCIDRKHIRMKCPTKAGSLFYNYKQFFSIVLPGVADSESRFILLDIDAYGKQSEAVHFLLLLYITSWKTLNVPYQSLQVLRDVEQKCLSSCLVMRPIL